MLRDSAISSEPTVVQRPTDSLGPGPVEDPRNPPNGLLGVVVVIALVLALAGIGLGIAALAKSTTRVVGPTGPRAPKAP